MNNTEELFKTNAACFSKSTDAWFWLEEELENVLKENIIEKNVDYNENCGDSDHTAFYKIKINQNEK
jgi:hypothetical protein